jgi:transcriptional regulator with XRE-family HTH domain
VSPQAFKRWQRALGWTNERAAQELCVSVRQVIYYRTGENEIRPQTARLCELLKALHARA